MKRRWLTAAAMSGAAAIWSLKAVDDRPPELEQPGGPDTLPSLAIPAPPVRGKAEMFFVGAQAFPTQELQKAIARQIQSIEEYGLDEASAYDAAFFLQSYYRKQGYPLAEVSSQINGQWQLTLIVSEGPQTKISEVVFRGNTAHDDKTLKDYLLGPTRERLPRAKAKLDLPYVEADLQTGADLVRRLYAAEGYLNAVVDNPKAKFSPDLRSARVSLHIREGIQYQIGRISFRGDLVYGRDVVLAAMAEELNQPFTEGRLAAAQRKLQDFYKKRGHFTANVEAIGDTSSSVKGKVPVSFRIAAGPVYRFDGVSVSGLDQLKPGFVENRFGKLRGRTYDPDAVDKQFRELIETGLFENVEIDPVPQPGNELRLDVKAEEAKPKELGFGLGFGSYEGGIVSFGYSDRNLFGSGRPFSFSTELTSRGYKGEVLYSDPWLFESDYSLRLRLYALTREVEGYKKFEYGFQPSISRKINDQWEVSAFLLSKRVSIEEIEIQPPELVGSRDYSVHALGVSQTVDFRNNPVNPSRGFYGITAVDAGFMTLGGDVPYVRGTFQFSYYFPVTKASVLAVGARGGVIAPGSDIDMLPIDERFFNGGSTTVRSFVERELGPKSRNGLPVGGEAFTVFNVEYTFPIFGDLKGAIFADAGNVSAGVGDFGFDDMRYALGVGLRYQLPVGPIRVDLGLNPSPKRDENSGAFHFSIGVAF
ncbi:MAG: outer membrane protein assembly factor BamA [Verrucomicrobiales bacterium]